MKTTKRILSIMLIAIMTFCLSAFNVSAEDNNCSITVNVPSDSPVTIVGRTFKAYKIFSAEDLTGSFDYTRDNTCLGYIEGETTIGGYSLSTIKTWDKDTDKGSMQTFANKMYEDYIKDQNPDPYVKSIEATSNSVKIDGLASGYYLVFGEANNVNGDSGHDLVTSLVMCTTATSDGNATVNLKLDAPSLDKQIQHSETDAWGVVGDNQIGDTVNFRLISTVPDINGYTNYDYIIHDEMTDGLTYGSVSKVEIYRKSGSEYAKNDELNLSYVIDNNSITCENDNHDAHIQIKIKDAIAAGVLKSGDKLYTYYTATLNTNAKVSSGKQNDDKHNDNTAYLQYSNNPYDSSSTGQTPPRTVYDWTYEFTVNKLGKELDNTDKPLEGATFTISDGTNVLHVKQLEADGDVDVYVIDSTSDKTTIDTPNSGIFKIQGLDDKTTYTIEETNAPNGYQKCAPFTFSLSEDTESNSKYNDDGNKLSKDVVASISDVENVSLEGIGAKVINIKGSTLVGTGGIGTTIFYIAGGVLMAGAVVLLIVKRRVNK